MQVDASSVQPGQTGNQGSEPSQSSELITLLNEQQEDQREDVTQLRSLLLYSTGLMIFLLAAILMRSRGK